MTDRLYYVQQLLQSFVRQFAFNLSEVATKAYNEAQERMNPH